MIKKIILALIILILALLGIVVLMLDSIIEKAIETLSSRTLHTSVQLDSANISLLKGTGTLNHLTIENPPGYPKGYLLEVNTVAFSIDLSSILSSTIHIPTIVITQPTVSLIAGPGGNNISALLNGISNNTQNNSASTQTSATNASSQGKKVEIDQLLITQIQVKADAAIAKTSFTIPRVEVDNIGKNGGVSIAQGITIGLQALLHAVLDNTGISSVVHGIGNTLKELIPGAH